MKYEYEEVSKKICKKLKIKDIADMAYLTEEIRKYGSKAYIDGSNNNFNALRESGQLKG